MAQTAAHLVDHVIAHVPVRKWVLSLPVPLRLLLAAQTKLVTPVLQVVHRVITRHLFIVMSPLEFMPRLAALVVPQEPEPPAQAAQAAECEVRCGASSPHFSDGPGHRGCGDWLRQGFAEPRFEGLSLVKTALENPETSATRDTLRGCYQSSTGCGRTQQRRG